MILRLAESYDEELLLSWRNDPVTRNASLTQHVIGKREHSKWFSMSLANPNRQIYIAENNGLPVGTFRIDTEAEFLFLSWTIAPEWRKKGLGKKMLQIAEIDEYKNLKAIIRKDNIPSIKLAHQLGLSLKIENNGLLYYLKND